MTSSKVFVSHTPKVYKNKSLNTANFGDFTKNDYQVFLHLISKIGGVDEFGKYLQPSQLKREHSLTAKEFSEKFNVNIHNSYKVLKRAVDKLMKTDIRIEESNNNGFTRINICSKAEYNNNSGYINIKFTDDIMPYLAQVKKKFVLYNLKEIANFGSLYTTRLYELIQDFKETGYMIKSVDQLREAFAVSNNLKLYADFKRFTFGHACKEINANYDIGLNFNEIKKGRKVIAVEFFFKKTIIHKVTDQKTGIQKNLYIKPESKIKTQKLKIEKSSPVILPENNQNVLEDIKSESTPLKNVLSNILAKLF